jgi:sugar phosphate isomerase/epimerase
MRLGGPIFKKTNNVKELIAEHRRLGFGAAYCGNYIADKTEREEYKAAFQEADIVLAEYPAYCINILDTDSAVRQRNIDDIRDRLHKADEMGARCCVMHGGSVETGAWGTANPENLSERSFIKTVEIIRSIVDEVQPQVTKLVLETESYLFPDGPEEYKRLLDAIDRPSVAVHLDPVNIIASPRRFYYNGDFLRQCFAILGSRIISCHAKDINMAPVYPTIRIDETFVGDGVLDYNTYLTEIVKCRTQPTLMIEHLNEAQLANGLHFLFAKAKEAGITFEGSNEREEISAEGLSTAYFAPHVQ